MRFRFKRGTKNEWLSFSNKSMDDPRIQEGIDMIQTMWYGVAIQVVNMAIRVYNLTPQQANALKDVYLRSNDYTVKLRE